MGQSQLLLPIKAQGKNVEELNSFDLASFSFIYSDIGSSRLQQAPSLHKHTPTFLLELKHVDKLKATAPLGL